MRLAVWQLDVSEWPVAVLALDRADGDDADFASFLRCAEEGLARRQRYAIVIDLTGNKADARRRAKLASWFADHRAEAVRYVIAMAVVARNPLERGVMTAMVWLSPPPFPL